MIQGLFARFSRGSSAAKPPGLKTPQPDTKNERRLIELCTVPAPEALSASWAGIMHSSTRWRSFSVPGWGVFGMGDLATEPRENRAKRPRFIARPSTRPGIGFYGGCA